MADGVNDTPKDAHSTKKLQDYWVHGEGAAKIAWGTPHDFDRCVVELGKYVGPGIVKGLCARYHKAALGVWPGQEDASHHNDHKK